MIKIAVLCSGGDSQGMNNCVQTIVNMAHVHKMEVMGIKYGYKGLINNDFVKLTPADVQTIGNLGGCFLKTARCLEFKEPKFVKKGYDNLVKNCVDYLIVIGGDGTYRGAVELSDLGAKVIAMPGTIDNDLFYTDRTLGFDTAVNNAVSAIDNIRQTMEANDRGVVFEVMGRECGDIALNTAVAVGAHSLAVKEIPRTVNDIIADAKKCMKNGVKSPIIVISEGNTFHAEDVKIEMEKQLGIQARACVIGYLQRGGAPSVLDREFATQLGITAIELINKDIYNVALGMQNFNVYYVKLKDVFNLKDMFNKMLYRQLRNLHNLD